MISPSLKKNGFTLIEMMITLAILGVVASIAIPAYNGYILTAKMTEARSNLGALRLAQEENFLENNSYFFGANTATVESLSSGLWNATNGDNGQVNFNYVVTPDPSGWTATATGNQAGTSTFNETVTITAQ